MKKIRKEAWWNWDGSTNIVRHYRASAKTVDDFGDLLQLRRCAICRCWLQANAENFQIRSRKPTGHVETYFAWCRPCMNLRRREKAAATPRQEKHAKYRLTYEAMRADPERLARRREKNRLAQQRWREGPGYQETRRRYREKALKDPKYRERENETQRLYYWLQQEREGRTLTARDESVDRDGPRSPDLPLEPLLAFMREQVTVFDRDEPTNEGRNNERRFIEEFGITAKTFFEWRTGKRKSVRLATVDRILTRRNRNWFDIYSKPANGHEAGRPEDVLKYIDEASVYIQACLAFEGELVE